MQTTKALAPLSGNDSGGNAIRQFLAVKGAVMIDIELVEQSASGRLRLVEIDRPILVGIEGLQRRRRERRRSARYDHRQRKRDRQQRRKRQCLMVVSFI